MNTQSEFEFLKDQVDRLNGVLSYYQDMAAEKCQKSGSNKLITSFNNFTPPLMTEYDRIIHELKCQLESDKSFIDQEKTRVNSIINENERLWKQVQEQSGSPGLSRGIPENMYKQVDSLTKEKKALEEVVKVCEIEVNRLQAEINEYKMKPETIIFNERVEDMKQRFEESLGELEREVVGLRDNQRELLNELAQMRRQCSEMEKDNAILVEKLRFEKEASEENSTQLKGCLKRLEYMDKEKKQLQINVEEVKALLRSHDLSKDEWSTALESLKSRYLDKEQNLYELNQKLKEAYQLAEDASSEKKTVEIRELQVMNECDRLRGVISGILEDAGVRTREEVDIVTEKYEKEVERVVEELNLCEQNRQELLAEIDQVKRSKAQLEQEMEIFHKVERERNLQDLSSAEVTHERMIRSERERETLRIKHSSMETQLEKEKIEMQRLKENFNSELSDIKNKMTNLQNVCDKAQANADRFAKLLNSSEESASQSRKKYQESLKRTRHEHDILKQTFNIQQQEYESRLQSTEETQRNTTAEMRNILHKQQQLSAKWKDEAHSLSNQYEERILQLSKELERERMRNNEMTALLQQSKQQILESHEIIEEKKQMIGMLDNRVRYLGNDGIDDIDGSMNGASSNNENNWQLQQIKKKQQKMIRESVARSMKGRKLLEYN